MASTTQKGYVYILVSPSTKYIKIGGTKYAPFKRIREINTCEPYKSLGPWEAHDFREVSDWQKVEYQLHYTFRSKLVKQVAGQRELFELYPVEASEQLEAIDESMIIKKPKVDRMFQDQEFTHYLAKLFRTTTLLNWFNTQGAWTFSLFPGTSGGRYYTININAHEVAYTTNSPSGEVLFNMLNMDKLIRDFKEVRRWVKKHNGYFRDGVYASSLPRSTSVYFEGSFADAMEFLSLDGVRRAIIAYWTESLVELQEKGNLSLHSKHHNWNAVSELKKRIVTGQI
jgi:hypothetical protein